MKSNENNEPKLNSEKDNQEKKIGQRGSGLIEIN